MSPCECHCQPHALWCGKNPTWRDGANFSPVVGYVIAERHVSGDRIGELDIDWDGKVHENREDAEYELRTANAPDSDDQTHTPSDHWKLYELREVA